MQIEVAERWPPKQSPKQVAIGHTMVQDLAAVGRVTESAFFSIRLFKLKARIKLNARFNQKILPLFSFWNDHIRFIKV